MIVVVTVPSPGRTATAQAGGGALHIEVVGDSQPHALVDDLVRAMGPGFLVHDATWPGAAACDFDPMNYRGSITDVVVFSTAGNQFSPCTQTVAGDPERVARLSALSAVAFCEQMTVPCFNLLQPPRFDMEAMSVERLNTLLRELAERSVVPPRLRRNDYAADGLHLADSGQTKWASVIAAAIQSLPTTSGGG